MQGTQGTRLMTIQTQPQNLLTREATTRNQQHGVDGPFATSRACWQGGGGGRGIAGPNSKAASLGGLALKDLTTFP
jgi:hypothetical protein